MLANHITAHLHIQLLKEPWPVKRMREGRKESHKTKLSIETQTAKISLKFTLKVARSDKATQSHSFQCRAGDFWRQERQRPSATGWGVSSDATKFRISQIYANEKWLSGATANRKEDGSAHVIILLSGAAVTERWRSLYSVYIYIIYSLLPPKCLYLAVRNPIRCQQRRY